MKKKMKKNYYCFTYTKLIDGIKRKAVNYVLAYTVKEAYEKHKSENPYKVDKMQIFINYNLPKNRRY